MIDLGDDMQFSKLPAGARADKLVCSDPTIPHDDSNLVIKVCVTSAVAAGFKGGCVVVGARGTWWHMCTVTLSCGGPADNHATHTDAHTLAGTQPVQEEDGLQRLL